MKTTKKWMSKLASLMMAVVLICTLLPVQADALVRKDIPMLCGSFDSSGEVVDAVPGIPMLSGDSMYVLTDDDLYTSSAYEYMILINEELVAMEYVTEFQGIACFSFTYHDPSICAPESQARIGEQYTLQAMGDDTEILSASGTITGYNSTPTAEGFYKVDVQSNLTKSEVYAPVAVLNADGGLVAVMVDEGELTFSEPVGGSGNNGGGGEAPVPARPQPEEPAETETPNPAQTEPQKPTNPADPTDPTDPTGSVEEPSVLEKYMLPIVGAVALIVLAVVAVLILRKPKAAPVPPQPWPPQPPQPPQPPVPPQPWGEIDVTKPGPDVTKSGPDLWETVPEGGTFSLTDSSGLLGGQTFRIAPAGALIGRAEAADIQYPANTKGVSRNHCRVYVQGNSLMVIDNGSTSGTYLLGKGQLRTGNPTEVKDGDVICLGSKKVSLTVRKNG